MTQQDELLLAELERKVSALVYAARLALVAMENMRQGRFKFASAELRKALGETPQ